MNWQVNLTGQATVMTVAPQLDLTLSLRGIRLI